MSGLKIIAILTLFSSNAFASTAVFRDIRDALCSDKKDLEAALLIPRSAFKIRTKANARSGSLEEWILTDAAQKKRHKLRDFIVEIVNGRVYRVHFFPLSATVLSENLKRVGMAEKNTRPIAQSRDLASITNDGTAMSIWRNGSSFVCYDGTSGD